ncbi:MAG: endonuclease/exonuclease/phosphatase family protein [Actinobacteria bacterium]|nr:endonuclease/exonuclease/phosphatase family protein [Actinomycetota bacterium]
MADRPARLVTALRRALVRIRESLPLLGWIATASIGFVAISQAFGFTWIPALWVLQALTPLVLGAAAPLAVIGVLTRRRTMAAVNLGVLIALVWLVFPVVFHADPGARAPDARPLSVVSGNVYYRTDRPDEIAAALLALDADVIAMTEFSAPVEDAFARLDADGRYPFVAARAPGDRNGVAVYSRYPIIDRTIGPIGQGLAVDVVLDVDGVATRVVVVHPLPGTDGPSLEAWSGDLAAIGTIAGPDADGARTLIVGDFNATRWHPAFRDLLRRGWRDAHEVLGDGWSRSWPTGGPIPPLVRIDHALVGDAVAVTDVSDVALPGSDHRGFVVTVAIDP